MRRRQPHRPPCRERHRVVVSTRPGGRWGRGAVRRRIPLDPGKAAAVPIADHAPAVGRRGRRAPAHAGARRPAGGSAPPTGRPPVRQPPACPSRRARCSRQRRRSPCRRPAPGRTRPWRPRPPAVRAASGWLAAPALAWARASHALAPGHAAASPAPGYPAPCTATPVPDCPRVSHGRRMARSCRRHAWVAPSRTHTGARRGHVGTADAMPAHAWRAACKNTNATRRGIGMTYVHSNYIGIRVGPGVSGRHAGEGGGPGAAATPTNPARRSRRAGRPGATARTRARYSRAGVGSAASGTGKRRSATARARAWPPRRS